MNRKKKFYIKTYGCKLNQADSILIRGFLLEKFEEAGSESDADFVVINGCGVIEKTENKATREILRLKGQGKKVILGGCLPLISEKSAKIADGVFSLKTINKSALVCQKALFGKKAVFLGEKNTENKRKADKASFFEFQKLDNNLGGVIKIIPISKGCLGNCSYCASRIARGTLNSFKAENILREIRDAVLSGKKEIQITSQGAAQYGLDKGSNGIRLPGLLNMITSLEGDFMIRVGMMNPRFALPIINKILTAYNNPKIYKFIHLPLQSGDNEILSLMNRGYKAEDFIYIIRKFKEKFPESLIATDVIVGFPGENEKAFQKTIKVLKKTKPHIINITKYSPRKGTEAAKMESQIQAREKNRRASIIEKLSKEIRIKDNKRFIGKKLNVFIAKKQKNGTFLARTNSFKAVVLPAGSAAKEGERANVTVTGYEVNYLKGLTVF